MQKLIPNKPHSLSELKNPDFKALFSKLVKKLDKYLKQFAVDQQEIDSL
jgi:biotin-(acetyl-CoA carboxylase) ligase